MKRFVEPQEFHFPQGEVVYGGMIEGHKTRYVLEYHKNKSAPVAIRFTSRERRADSKLQAVTISLYRFIFFLSTGSNIL